MTVIIEFMDDIMENSMDIIDDIIEFIEIFFENSKNRTSDSMTILNAIPDGTFAGRSNRTVVTDNRQVPSTENGSSGSFEKVPYGFRIRLQRNQGIGCV